MHNNPPQVVTTVAQLRETLAAVRCAGKRIGLVPTMGALHEGHLSLVREARAECDFTVVSIFVNPTQFGPNEDFAKYPRTLDADLALLAGTQADAVPAIESGATAGLPSNVASGATAGLPSNVAAGATTNLRSVPGLPSSAGNMSGDTDRDVRHSESVALLVFAPAKEEVYPPGSTTLVEPGSVAEPLEGVCRPGHFRGVVTVVLKLLNMVQPDVAYFGQKDFQQVRVIQTMVADLNVPTAIRVCPIVREPDGLAMSSRNRYLGPAARQRATALWKSMQLAGKLVEQGERRAAAIAAKMRTMLEAADAQIDYVALVDPETLQPVETITKTTLAVLAVKIENIRLIDNCLLKVPREKCGKVKLSN